MSTSRAGVVVFTLGLGVGCSTLEPYEVKDRDLLYVTARDNGVQLGRGQRVVDARAKEVGDWFVANPEALAAYDRYRQVARISGAGAGQVLFGPAAFTADLREAVALVSASRGQGAPSVATATTGLLQADRSPPWLTPDPADPTAYRLGLREVAEDDLAEVLAQAPEASRLHARAEELRHQGTLAQWIGGAGALVGTGAVLGFGEAWARRPEGEVPAAFLPLALGSAALGLVGAVGWVIGTHRVALAESQELEAINAYNDAVALGSAGGAGPR